MSDNNNFGGTKLLVGLLAVALVLSACAPIPKSDSEANSNTSIENDDGDNAMMEEDDAMMEEEDSMMEEDDAMMEEEDSMMEEDHGDTMSDSGDEDTTPDETAPVTEKNVALSAVGGSDIFGSVALTAIDDKTRAVVSLSTLSGKTLLSVHPIFIHEGTCASLGIARQVLNHAVNGRSVTTIGVPLARITADGDVAVVVQAATNNTTVVACGNIPN